MEKKIEDYLHLYLGCEVIYPDTNGKQTRAVLTGVSRQDGVETTYKRKRSGVVGEYLSWKSNGSHDCDALHMKLILRPLKSMEMDELIDFIHVGEPDIDVPYSEFEEALNEIRSNGIGGFAYDDVPPAVVFNQVKWFLSKHFDLFGLIEAGLAINKTTHP